MSRNKMRLQQDIAPLSAGRLSGVLLPPGRVMLWANMCIVYHLKAPRSATRLAGIPCLGLGLLLVAALAAGCASSDTKRDRAGGFQVMSAPMTPLFLNGPMALLLTNAEGFRARVVLEGAGISQASPTTAGELMVRGSKLLFAPEPVKVGKKQPHPEDSAFIWDVNENRGYVLNEPLQAYAPISSSRQFTNVTVGPASNNASPEKVSGHLCQATEVTVTASDGVATGFQVWRAADLKGLPLRIHCPSGGVPLTLTLSKVHLEALPSDLFQPPNGFTKYDSAEGMMTEMALRKVNMSRKRIGQPLDFDEIGSPDTRVPNRPN